MVKNGQTCLTDQNRSKPIKNGQNGQKWSKNDQTYITDQNRSKPIKSDQKWSKWSKMVNNGQTDLTNQN